MFSASNQKVQQTRKLLADLISDLDVMLADVRTVRHTNFGRDGSDSEPDYLRRIAGQRDVLNDVATMLADMHFEWRGEPLQQREGESRTGGESSQWIALQGMSSSRKKNDPPKHLSEGEVESGI